MSEYLHVEKPFLDQLAALGMLPSGTASPAALNRLDG